MRLQGQRATLTTTYRSEVAMNVTAEAYKALAEQHLADAERLELTGRMDEAMELCAKARLLFGEARHHEQLSKRRARTQSLLDEEVAVRRRRIAYGVIPLNLAAPGGAS